MRPMGTVAYRGKGQGKGKGRGEGRLGQGGRGRSKGGEKLMGTTAYGGKGSKGRAANGDRPVGAASCRREHHTMASCQNPPPRGGMSPTKGGDFKGGLHVYGCFGMRLYIDNEKNVHGLDFFCLSSKCWQKHSNYDLGEHLTWCAPQQFGNNQRKGVVLSFVVWICPLVLGISADVP